MSSFSSATVVGNLGQDVVLRYTDSGTAVANLRVATNDSYTDAKGQKQVRTEWHAIVAWGKVAEACKKYLKKGSKVLATGRLQTREYTSADGEKRTSTELVAAEVVFLDPKAYQAAGRASAEAEAA